MDLIIQVLVSAVAFFIGAKILRGVHIEDFIRALIVAIVFGLLNATLGSALKWLATPINWITLGLAYLIINALIIKIADYFLKGFKVDSFVWAFGLAVIIAIVNTVAGWMNLI